MVVLSDADRARISAAVAAAEMRSAGEIVTIVAPRSDAYHDVALHMAILAMLLVGAIAALLPAAAVERIDAVVGGWDGGIAHGRLVGLLLAAMVAAFLIVRAVFAWPALRLALTPPATRTRRVRARAILLFRAAAERRTTGRTGVLLYLSTGERRAEIVADAAIHGKVAPEAWGEAMRTLIAAVRDGRAGDGMVAAVEAIGAILATHLPRASDDVNELPDGPIEL